MDRGALHLWYFQHMAVLVEGHVENASVGLQLGLDMLQLTCQSLIVCLQALLCVVEFRRHSLDMPSSCRLLASLQV